MWQTVMTVVVGIVPVIAINMSFTPMVASLGTRPIVVIVCRPVGVAPSWTTLRSVIVMAFSRPVPRATAVLLVPSIRINYSRPW